MAMEHTPDEGGGNNAFLSAEVYTNVPSLELDVKNDSWQYSPKCIFDGSGIAYIRLAYVGRQDQSNFCSIAKIEVYVGSVLWRTLTFWCGNTLWRRGDYTTLKNEKVWVDGRTSIDIGLFSDTYYLGQGTNPYEGSSVTLNNEPSFTSAGTKAISLKIWYLHHDSVYGRDSNILSNCSTVTMTAGYVEVKSPVCSSLTISGGKRSFYSGEAFDYSSLVVVGAFKYAVGGGSAYSSAITGYSVSDPSADFDLAKYSEVSETSITVSYGGQAASYPITIYGYKSHTKPTAQSPRNTSVFRKGESYTLAKSTITYGDDQTAQLTVSISGFDASEIGTGKTANYSISDSTIGDQYTWTGTYDVYGLDRIELDTSSVTKNFDMDDTLSATGLGVTAVYGANSEAGTESISLSDVTITMPEKAVGPNQEVTVSYNDGYDTKNASYQININGLAEMAYEMSDGAERLRVAKNGVLAYGNVSFKIRRYVNGVLSSWTSDTPAVTLSSFSTATAGEYEATFSCTEDGATVSANVPVTVYEISSISVSNYPKTAMFYEGTDYPTVDLSSFRVIATTSDNEEIELSYNAVNNGYEVLIGDIIQENDEITLSSDTTLTVRSRTEQSASQEISLSIAQKAAKSGGELRVNGPMVYATVGTTIDLSGFVVEQEMNDGTFEEISDYSCVIYGKGGLVFGSGDTLGDTYDLVFSKNPSESTMLEDAVMLNGISDVTVESIGKEVYDIGEPFDSSRVTYTTHYYYGNDVTGRSGGVTSDYDSTSFTLAQAGDATGVGEVTVTLTILGFTKTVTAKVRKVIGLAKYEKASKNYAYKIHQALNPAGNGYSFKKKYNSKDILGNFEEFDVADSDISFAFTGAGTGCSASDLIPTTSTSAITVTATYTENGASATCSFAITCKRLRNLYLVDADAHTVGSVYLNKGDHLDMSPYRLYYVLNDGTGETLTLDASSAMSPADNTIINAKVTGASITYTYTPGDYLSATYTIHVRYVSALTTNLASVVDETYYVGDVLDLSTVTASRTISSTDYSDPGDYPKTESFTPNFVLNSMNLSGDSYTFVTAGNYSVSFTDSGLTKSADFAVLNVTLSSISVSHTSAYKSLADYVEGQRLDLTGTTITKTYNNGNTVELSYSDANVALVDENGDSFSKTKELVLADDATELYFKVVENGVTKTAAVELDDGDPVGLSVAANELTSIEVASTSGHQTTFTYGDRFSIDNLMIKANFLNGSSQNPLPNALTISGVTVGHEFNPTDDQNFGTIAITVSYTHGGITKTCSYNITLAKPVLTSIATNASSDAVVTQFVDGTTYSESGLAVAGTFANGWTCAIASTYWSTNSSSVLTLSGSTITMTGDYGAKTITVSCTNPYDANQAAVTTTYTVDILTSGAIVSCVLMFDDDVDYQNYTVGDTFDAKGVYFHIVDIDGTETNVRSFSTSLPKGTVLRSSQRMEIECTYVKGSFSKTATYKILIAVPNLITFTETNDYQLAIGKSDGTLFTELVHEEQTIKFGKVYDSVGNVTGEYYPLFHEDKVQVDDNSSHPSTVGYNVYTGTDAEGDCIGYIDLGVTAEDGTVVRQAHVILFDDPLNPIDGQGNVEVTFPHYVSGYADRINKCHFGIVYNNRLFVSGNPDHPSCDWHSGAVNVSQDESYDRNSDLDFTYFSDLDYCYYGTEDTAIVGYDTYRDGDLLTIKQGSRFQATLYRRSYKLIAAQSYDGTSVAGDSSLAEEAFPMFDVNANGGIGGLSSRGIANFSGETLILTKEGLKAITNKESVYSTAKYSFPVSSYIDPKIKDENLEDAFLFTFKDKVLLHTDRGVYVGYDGLRNEDGEYEWYFLANLDATSFFEHDGELFFANDDGEVFRFPSVKKDFVDKDRDFVGEGGTYLTLDDSGDKIIASNAYADAIVEGRAFHLLTTFNVNGAQRDSQVHASLGKFVSQYVRANKLEQGASFDDSEWSGTFDPDTGKITVQKRTAASALDVEGTIAIQDLYYDGRKVRFDTIIDHSGDLRLFVDYTLAKNADGTYSIKDGSGNSVSLAQVDSFRMCFVVNDLAVTYIQDVEPYGTDGAKSFSLLGDHSKKLDLVYYNNQNGYYSGVVTAEENVKSYFVTAPYSMGSIALTKTVWAWIIANDTNLASYMDVGYVSSRKQGGFETIVKSSPASRKINFGTYDFSKVSFLNDSLPHVYSKYRTLPNVNFIRFVFKNEENSNLALTAMELIYTISGFAKGVK